MGYIDKLKAKGFKNLTPDNLKIATNIDRERRKLLYIQMDETSTEEEIAAIKTNIEHLEKKLLSSLEGNPIHNTELSKETNENSGGLFAVLGVLFIGALIALTGNSSNSN